MGRHRAQTTWPWNSSLASTLSLAWILQRLPSEHTPGSWRGPSFRANTLTWLPLVLFAAEGILQQIRGSVADLALAAGLQLLAGSLPDVLSSWILIAFFLLGRLVGKGALTSAKVLLRVGAGVVLAARRRKPRNVALPTRAGLRSRSYVLRPSSALAALGAEKLVHTEGEEIPGGRNDPRGRSFREPRYHLPEFATEPSRSLTRRRPGRHVASRAYAIAG